MAGMPPLKGEEKHLLARYHANLQKLKFIFLGMAPWMDFDRPDGKDGFLVIWNPAPRILERVDILVYNFLTHWKH